MICFHMKNGGQENLIRHFYAAYEKRQEFICCYLLLAALWLCIIVAIKRYA